MSTGFYRTQIDSSNYWKFHRNTLNLISSFLSRDNAKVPTAEYFQIKGNIPPESLSHSHRQIGAQINRTCLVSHFACLDEEILQLTNRRCEPAPRFLEPDLKPIPLKTMLHSTGHVSDGGLHYLARSQINPPVIFNYSYGSKISNVSKFLKLHPLFEKGFS